MYTMLGFAGMLSSIPIGKLTKSYLVCATPRSGSTLLCAQLAGTGVAGRPEEYFECLWSTGMPRQPREYFDGVHDPDVLDLLAPSDPGTPESTEVFEQRLQDALRDGMTPNGVWASKMMWGYWLDFLRRLRERDQTAGLHAHQAVERLLPGVQFVHARRRDKLAQAISLWTAVQTAQWRDEEGESTEHDPVYSYRGIAHLLEQLTQQDQAWTRWFTVNHIEPHVVAYEDLVAHRNRVVCGLLADLQIDNHGVEVPEPALRKQSGGRSAEWAERFEADRKVLA
jgi:LPS sulfotransferase NodH